MSDKRSVISRLSARSNKSSSSKVDTIADIAALRVKLNFIDHENATRTELQKLKTKRELAMAEARLSVYEQEQKQEFDIGDEIKVSDETNMNYVASYIQSLSEPKETNTKSYVPPTDVMTPSVRIVDTPAVGAGFQHVPSRDYNNRPLISTQLYPETAMKSASSTHNQDINVANLTKTLAEQMNLSRLPPPEPIVFDGDPLKYPAWKSSFETLIEGKGIGSAERLYYLKKYLSGAAREAVEGYFLLTTNGAYEEAKKLLDDRYGSNFQIASAFREKLDLWPKIGNRDSSGLRKYGDFLRQCVTAMETIDNLSVLNDAKENKAMVSKLPEWLIFRWGRIVSEYKERTKSYPPFKAFMEFVTKEANIACDPLLSSYTNTDKKSNLNVHAKQFTPKGATKKSTSLSTEATDSKDAKAVPNTNKSQNKCLLCQETHDLEKCKSLMAKPLEQRKQFLWDNELCFGCLKTGHRSKACQNRLSCRTCSKLHATPLHGDLPVKKTPKISDTTEATQAVQSGVSHLSEGSVNDRSGKCSMILPVWISHADHPKFERLVYALLDTQSDTTFILEDTCKAMGISGHPVQLKLSTMTAKDHLVDSAKYKGLIVRGVNNDIKISLPTTYSRDIMPANLSHVPTPEKAKQWPHLAVIADELMNFREIEVGLLIGYDCPHALIPREVIPPVHDGDPYGEKTDLGWGIVGNVSPCEEHANDQIGLTHRIITQEVPSSLSVNIDNCRKAVNFSVSQSIKESILPYEVRRLMEQDFSEQRSNQMMSMDDKKFIDSVSAGIHLSDGHYELPLPFKDAAPNLPNNKGMALHRLKQLESRFKSNAKFKEDYTSFMQNIIDNGHAECVPENELQVANGAVWYIPHHGIYHNKKPDRIRVVFDCSARYSGVSLNDFLLKGPDLTNDLIGVLCKFRLEKIAVMCDIEQMFYQFRVNPEHRNYLRFLWWDSGKVAEFRMKVHLFGAASSPGCANFCLKQTASDGENQFSAQAIQFVRHSFYVDDGLTSVSSVEKAVDLVRDSKKLCALKGLRLHKFMSNSKEVMATIPLVDQAKEMQNLDLFSDPLPMERALGVQWSVELDAFQFRITFMDRPLTRRGVLSTVSSIYDPLGFLAPVVLQGKLILQQLCKAECDWDDPLPPDLKRDWEKWRDSLVNLNSLRIPRCIKPAEFGEVRKMELHHFSDASTSAYGQCSYVRLVDDQQRVHCALLMGKSRVTPMKPVTVPRLELTAAVVSVKISLFLKQELNLTDISEVFWTDSKITLGYINNDAKRFHIYVANRVQQIREQTSPQQWKHVADAASRGISPEKLQQSTWLTGPAFLWNPNIDFVPDPEVDVGECMTDDPEIKKVKSCSLSVHASESSDKFLERLQYFSDWLRLKKAVALCMKFIDRLKHKNQSLDLPMCKSVLVNDLVRSQTLILQHVQSECFSEEISTLKSMKSNETFGSQQARTRNKAIRGKSCLYKLDPFLDADGLLRVGGRLKQACLSSDMKHPVILPKTHHITDIIVRYCHEMVQHQGRGMTINNIRTNGFWVINCSSIVSRLILKCVRCRRLRGVTQDQKMADLPVDRANEAPPFTYSAVDFFGPFYVREGRKELKRYGVLFTCMACRAVHVETANSLTTSSFISALRRFICMRGSIRQLRSDRGTNFIGAKRELKEAMDEIDHTSVKQYLLKEDCDYFEFKFNVPSASHMGGSWERQIRTIRSVLSTLMDQIGTQLDDELLRTFMCEAAAIVNSRPLTVENLNDPLSLNPLTANSLLHMKSKVVLPPPGVFQKSDVYSAKRWRRVQYVANQFWIRWRKEFLQSLQSRQKWNKPKRNLCVGDVVLVKDDNMPRNKWLLGRVTETYPSTDSRVRKVKLAVSDSSVSSDAKGSQISFLERSVQKLVLLVENNNSQ